MDARHDTVDASSDFRFFKRLFANGTARISVAKEVNYQ